MKPIAGGGLAPATARMTAPLRDTAVDVLVQRIRALMRERGLAVGDHLPTERELSGQFAASRNTVREALRTLRAYGLIEVRPKIGTVVIDRSLEAAFDLFAFTMDVSQDTFADVQAFRRLIEVGIGEQLLAEGVVSDLARLDAINGAMRDAASVAEAADQDYEFHATLVGLAGNRTLRDIYRFLKPVILRLMFLGKHQQAVLADTYADHDAIVEALRLRDRVAFAYRMSRHLEFGARFVDDAADPETSPPKRRKRP